MPYCYLKKKRKRERIKNTWKNMVGSFLKLIKTIFKSLSNIEQLHSTESHADIISTIHDMWNSLRQFLRHDLGIIP